MKITIYTIPECQFSKAEKDYLTSHTLTFEEKNLETNKDFLTEMLAVSNNFAGTPVTKIEKDDGTISVLKGFTKEEFDKTLGFETQAQPAAPTPPPAAEDKKPEPVAPAPPAPDTTMPPVVEDKKQDQLNGVLDKLEDKTVPTEGQPAQPIPPAPVEPIPPTPVTPEPVTTPPVVEAPPTTNPPSIPDFPADAAPQPVK